MEGKCLLRCCVHPTVNNVRLGTYQLACFLSHFIELKVQSGSVPFTKLFFSFEYWGKLLGRSKSKTQNRHYKIERACSWIETVYSFSVYLYRTESCIGQRLFERLCSAVEPLEQIQCSYLAYRTEGSVGSVSEQNWTRVFIMQSNHWSKSSVQNTNRTCLPQN